jgi:UDP-N-acetylglucosamine--N-acetylmuramyl-(pentapeptide) pyrophosphoryl-undecaprenol N-acetylglucosamine transferase
VLITGGGTGGHLYPALAIAGEFSRRIPCEILFVGTKRGLEGRLIPEKGYRFRSVWISGFRRGKLWANLLFPVKVFVSLVQALILVDRFQPDVLIGTGGYVSWPLLMAGILLRKRTVIQEQNWMPGVATRVLAPHVNSVHLSFETSRRFFRHQSNLMMSGNPTRDDSEGYSRNQGYLEFGLQPGRKTLFIFGGSQGARSINQVMLGLLESLMEKEDLQILWGTGPRWFDEIREKTEGYSDRVRVLPYIQTMGMAYSVGDLLICRAGATTVAEVARLGLPAVFIPFPAAAGGHQEGNARVLLQAGAAEMVLEEEMRGGKLENVLIPLLNDSRRRREMGKRARRFGKPDAAVTIVDDVLNRVMRA